MNLIGEDSQYLTSKRGDTLNLVFEFNLVDSADKLDLTNCSARLHLQYMRTGTIFVNATTDNGLLTIDEELGLVKLSVPASTMAQAKIGRYLFDLELTFPDGFVLSSETNTLEIIKDITEI